MLFLLAALRHSDSVFTGMASRLEELAASLQQVHPPSHELSPNLQAHNPQGHSPDNQQYPANTQAQSYAMLANQDAHNLLSNIRSEQELADFNQFMLSLGKDASGSANTASKHLNQGQSGVNDHYSPFSTDSSNSDALAQSELFDPAALAQLGLGGMPGIPTGNHGQTGHGKNSIGFNAMYPDMSSQHKASMESLHGANSHRDSLHASGNQVGKSRSNRLSDGGTYSDLRQFSGNHHSGSRDMSQSLPGPSAFGHGDMLGPDTHSGLQMPDAVNYTSFDSLARPRAQMPVPRLEMPNTSQKVHRSVDLLGASKPRPGAPKSSLDILTEACEREFQLRDQATPLCDEPESMDIKMEDGSEAFGTSPPLPAGRLSEREANPEFKLPALRLADKKSTGNLRLTPLRSLSIDSDWTTSSSPRRGSLADDEPTTPTSSATIKPLYPSFSSLIPGVASLLSDEPKRSYHSNSAPSVDPKRRRHAQVILDILRAVNHLWRADCEYRPNSSQLSSSQETCKPGFQTRDVDMEDVRVRH